MQDLLIVAAGNRCEVPSARYPTIQSAIDDRARDLIVVAPGVYVENLVIDRTLTLRGAGPGASVIDGGGRGTAVKVLGGDPTIEGFTITRGDGTRDGGEGGGILVAGASAMIRNNTISDNVASGRLDLFGWGGGIYVKSTTWPVNVEGNAIQGNVAFRVPIDSIVTEGLGGGAGGGIAIGPGASANVAGNTIRSNLAYTRGDRTSSSLSACAAGGGGIFSRGDVTNIGGNIIEDNCVGLIGNLGRGGGIDLSGREAVVTDNRIARNTALAVGPLGRGGGISVTGSFQKVTIFCNWIEENVAMVQGSLDPESRFIAGGGGLHISGLDAVPGNTVSVQSNYIVGNVLTRTIDGMGGPGSVIGEGAGGSYITSCASLSFAGNEVRDNVAVESLYMSGPGTFGRASGPGSVFRDVEMADVRQREVRYAPVAGLEPLHLPNSFAPTRVPDRPAGAAARSVDLPLSKWQDLLAPRKGDPARQAGIVPASYRRG